MKTKGFNLPSSYPKQTHTHKKYRLLFTWALIGFSSLASFAQVTFTWDTGPTADGGFSSTSSATSTVGGQSLHLVSSSGSVWHTSASFGPIKSGISGVHVISGSANDLLTITFDSNNDGIFGDAFTLNSILIGELGIGTGTTIRLRPNGNDSNGEDFACDDAFNYQTFTPSNLANFTNISSLVVLNKDKNSAFFVLDDIQISDPASNATPSVTAPSAPTGVLEDAANVPLSDDIHVDDADGDPQTLTFMISGGTLTLDQSGSIGGGISYGGSGNGSASFTASGSLADLNTALDDAVFSALANLNGVNVATISFTASDGPEISPTASVSFSILPVNDAPSFALPGSPNQIVSENAGAQTVSSFANSISPGGGADETSQSLSFNVFTNNDDLFAVPPSINSSTGNLTYTPASNASGSATVTVSLSDNGGGADTSDEQVFTITVNPLHTVSVSDVSQNEGTSFVFTVSLSEAAPPGGATVDYATTENTASASLDYTSVSGTLGFSAGESSKSIEVITIADNTLEANETFTLSLSNPTGTDISLGDNTGIGTILNDDAAAVTIADVSGNEDDGSITLTASLDNPVQGGFTVEVNTADGTASTVDSDYAAITGQTLTFSGTAGETQTFTLTPGSDSKLEADETVSISQANLSGTSLAVDITDGATITILNDDAAAITIADVSGNEDDGDITVTASLDNPVQGGFTIDVNTTDGTATTGDSDYTSISSETLTFTGTAGETQTFTLTPTSDSKLEPSEQLIVFMNNLASTTLAVDITDGASVTILNDDAAAVTIADVSGNEDDGNITVTASLDNEVQGGFTVDVNTTDGTATAGDSDYTGISSETLTFTGTAGETQTFTLTPTSDSKLEPNEQLTVFMNNLASTTLAVDITDGASITILNDDAAAITIADVSGNEDDGDITVTASLDNPVQGGFTVEVSTADGTASTVDSDYAAITGQTLTFSGTAGETQTFTLTPGSDSKLEADETVNISQANLSGTSLAVDITDGATVTILNDDAAALTIADVSGNEDDGIITVTASLDNAVQGGFTVDVNTTDGTATTGDSDYTGISSETLTFTGTAGETQTFTLTPTSDSKLEPNEQLTVFMNNLASTTLAIDITDGASITILNDDAAAITIADVSGNEDDGDITVTASLDNPVQGGFTVDVNTTDGTATTGDSDYTGISSETLTFTGTAGETQTFTLTPTSDSKLEPNEQLTVFMNNLASTTLAIDITDGASITILNDDAAAITIADVSGNEDDGDITVTASLDNPVQGGFTVEVSTADGTASTVDSDYAAITGQTLTFSGTAGETQTFTLTPGSDSKLEADETLSISQANLSGTSLAVDITDGATATILNDDAAALTIADVSGNEDDGIITVTASLDNAVQGGFTVDVNTTDGTATTGDSDYIGISSETLTFSGTAGETQTFTLTPGSDSKLEADEIVSISQTNLSGTSLAVDITDGATITILNDDAAAITIADVSGNEDDGNITVTASLDNAVQGGFTVEVNTADGTASKVDSDYAAITGQTLTFSGTAGETQTFTLTPGSDSKLEADETVSISQANLSGTSLAVDITDGATVTILNDDAAAVTIANVSGNEDDGDITVTSSLDNAVQGGFTVDVHTSNGTASTVDGDYAAITGQTLTFTGTAGETQTFTLTPTSDSKLEPSEQLTVFMNNLASTTLAVDITDGASVTILNDDAAAVTIADVSGNEDDGIITVTASLDNAVQGGFTVDVNTTDGTATTGDSDYIGISSETLTFSGTAGETQTFTLTPGSDSKLEADETVSISQANLSGTSLAVDITDGATATILNDDAAAVTIADVSGNEDDGIITVTASLDNAVQGGFTVDVHTSNGTASTVDSDYAAITGQTLTFTGTAGETQTFTLTPGSDSKLEADETVSISQANLSGTSLAVDITDGATATILNDDAAALTIADVSGNEDDGSITLTATLNNAVQGGFTVDVNTTDGTATTGDSDYTSISSETLTFTGTAGETQTFTLTPGSDSKLEADETVSISQANLSGTSLAVDITDGATATILNDDAAAVTIADVSGNEDDGIITVTASLDNPVQGGFTVEVSTADGTASTVDSDYAAITGQTLTFSGTAGETQTFTLTPGSDSKLEADETVSISQANLSGTSLAVDITDGATITILNDDAAAITIADVSGNEDDGIITVTASLDNPVQGGFTVDVNTTDGTATTGDSDYTGISSETLTFVGTAGETQTFTLTPTSDSKLEADETVSISQANLSGTSLAVDITDGATATILNDDAAAVTIADVSGNEDDGIITVTASLDNPVQGGFTVDVHTSNGTASTVDSDYAAITGQTLTFSGTAGETQTFTLTPTSDSKLEADETVSISQANLSGTSLAVDITDGATATILNDDAAALTIADVSGNEDDGIITVTASLDNPVQGGFTVDVNTTDGTATTGDSDYSAISSETLTFTGNPGETQTIVFTPVADAKVEPNETVIVSLGNLGHTSLSVSIADGATVTILNDDHTPFIPASQYFSVSEHAEEGFLIGTVTAEDLDEGTTFSNWKITAGNDSGYFVLDKTNGELRLGTVANTDFEISVSFTLSLTVSDGSNTSAEETVTITVIPVNDEPSFTIGADETILEDAGEQTIIAWVTEIDKGATNESDQSLTFTVIHDNNSLFSVQPQIDSNGTLSYTPAVNANGVAKASVVLSDNGGTDNSGDDTSAPQTFTITVVALNDAPQFALLGNPPAIMENDSAQSLTDFITEITPGGGEDEVNQALTFTVSQTGKTSNLSFDEAPAISPEGVLTYTPASRTSGTASFDVFVYDDGVPTAVSDTQSFTITVNELPNNSPIVVQPVSDQIWGVGFGSTTVDLSNVFQDPDGDHFFLSAYSEHEDIVTVSVLGRILTLEEVGIGTSKITLIAQDMDGSTMQTEFLVTVELILSGIPDLEEVLSLYPNPTEDRVFLESSYAPIQSVVVYDVFGKQIAGKATRVHKRWEVDLQDLGRGVYLLQVEIKDQLIFRQVLRE